MTINGGQFIRHRIEGGQIIVKRISDAELVDRRPKDGQIFYGSDTDARKNCIGRANHFGEFCLTETDVGNLRLSWIDD